MKKIKTKKELSICLDKEALEKISGYENKSKYIESLVYKNLKKIGQLKKDIIL